MDSQSEETKGRKRPGLWREVRIGKRVQPFACPSPYHTWPAAACPEGVSSEMLRTDMWDNLRVLQLQLHFQGQVLTFQWHSLRVFGPCSTECPSPASAHADRALSVGPQLTRHLCLSTARLGFQVRVRADVQTQRKVHVERDCGKRFGTWANVRPPGRRPRTPFPASTAIRSVPMPDVKTSYMYVCYSNFLKRANDIIYYRVLYGQFKGSLRII